MNLFDIRHSLNPILKIDHNRKSFNITHEMLFIALTDTFLH